MIESRSARKQHN